MDRAEVANRNIRTNYVARSFTTQRSRPAALLRDSALFPVFRSPRQQPPSSWSSKANSTAIQVPSWCYFPKLGLLLILKYSLVFSLGKTKLKRPQVPSTCLLWPCFSPCLTRTLTSLQTARPSGLHQPSFCKYQNQHVPPLLKTWKLPM